MKQNPAVVIELSGHTDNVGSPESNQVLSENRAKAVYAYLIRAILKPDRFRFKGYGERRPLASNTTEEGRAENRRTELMIISSKGNNHQAFPYGIFKNSCVWREIYKGCCFFTLSMIRGKSEE